MVANAYDSFFFWGKIYWENYLLYCVGGLVFGFGLLWLVRWVGSKAFRREAMGMGDVFLMGAVGALFGPVAVLVTLILSSVFGSIVGVGMILLSKTKLGKFVAIPYGPYICLGCLAWMFWGPRLVHWYLMILFIGRILYHFFFFFSSAGGNFSEAGGVAREAQFLVYYPPFCPRWAG